ncbi:DNA recombination protein RmuC [Candidatus Saccharibacteria bacterium]|nr:DNA recombination protein RmuC [Candidatus Saccharibacteria bacterium]
MEVFMIILLSLILFFSVLNFFKKREKNDKDLSKLEERLIRIEGEIDKLSPKISDEFRENRKEISENFKNIQESNEKSLNNLQTSNEKRLEQMRETVDEKLKASVEKRFNESFSTISKQLTQVYEGLGEMKNLANDVGGLKKVMDGVKTRGNYGEVQLGAIISDMLAPAQYVENVVTKKGTADRVEFAIKMPGNQEMEVLLPIDSKFPVENYQRLLDAYDSGDKEKIAKFQKALSEDVKTQAKKISSKYIDVPYTTEFAVMFLPTESLFAEVARIPGLTDEIRSKFNVTVTCPSTLPAILNGLQAGFRSYAIEKQTAEVWKTLGAVRTQFGKFGDLLDAVQKKLSESANKIESAKTTSRQIERKLKDVEALPEKESIKMIGEIE